MLPDAIRKEKTMDVTKKLKELIDRSRRPLITAHIRLDGDALGSELAFYHALKAMGKEPAIVNDSSMPRVYKFMVKDADVRCWNADTMASLSAGGESYGFDLAIVVDTPAAERVGGLHKVISTDIPVVNIDHHVCNYNFGDINMVETEKCSTGEIVFDFFCRTGIEITPKIAEALYVAIVTDTGRFMHRNTTSDTLRAAAYLIDHGADPTDIGQHLYKTNTYGQLQLLSMAIDTLSFHFNKRIACIWLTKEMMRKAHTPPIDTQDFADVPASLEGVEVGVLLREFGEKNMVKVSLRSRNGIDVNKVANDFGGGGHQRAAGFEQEGAIQEIQDRIVTAIVKMFESSKEKILA
ncbi:MAG: bifunctional oligoribonuclease/PAP phosphatase NrnA [Candidatus Brocadiales bacterium]